MSSCCIKHVDWKKIITDEAAYAEEHFSILVEIDEAIVLEAERMICDDIASIGLIRPNVAKIAGLVAFWIRKLKPLRVAANSPNRLLTLNEFVALRIGLAICNAYHDDNSKPHKIYLPPRVLNDWIKSFRYHAHSPHTSMIAFELVACDS